MIGYVMLGTKDLARGAKFYDAIAEELGAKRLMEDKQLVVWGKPGHKADFSLTYPWDQDPASVGNGTMVAIEAASKEQVDRVYEIAIANGASDEGAPGQRFETFYAGYFRDLDGNKLNVYYSTMSA
ncbi:VOC family protein [uncultured Hyphomonas sp.]|uniref:VOC family protein n=1 Tax=uncultured Hyphomonas sp. TaxID=225298 RepID=UPI002AAA9D49|nr:VOC family protein [uncultured Hyphomonas sp.]